MEQIKFKHLQKNIVKNADNKILKIWISHPDTFHTLKKVAFSIISIYSLIYALIYAFFFWEGHTNSFKNHEDKILTLDPNKVRHPLYK